MTASRLSRLQSRTLTWLTAEEQRTRGTMSASDQDVVHALGADEDNFEAKGLIIITRTLGGKAEAVDLTVEGRTRASHLTGSCD